MDGPQSLTLAILDEAQILRGFEQVDSREKWVHTKDRYPVPPGCDLGVGRYRLVQFMPGKFRFEALVHDKDGAVENLQKDINIIPVLARILGGPPFERKTDRADLVAYLQMFDAQG